MYLIFRLVLGLVWLWLQLEEFTGQIKVQLSNWKLDIRQDLRQLKWDLLALGKFLKALPGKLKRRVWNKHVLMTWNKLYVRPDEFHSSLDMDVQAMMEMNPEERESYQLDLMRRRQLAHDRDLAETAPPGMVFPRVGVDAILNMDQPQLEAYLQGLPRATPAS